METAFVGVRADHYRRVIETPDLGEGISAVALIAILNQRPQPGAA